MTQKTEKKKPLIILTGPTAVGKTAASIGLAKAIGGEIISADSMQVYRHMDIGSAKILPEEMKGVKHYLIDVLNPEEEFNVAVFQKMAKDAMVEIYKRGRIPIVDSISRRFCMTLILKREKKTLPIERSWKRMQRSMVRRHSMTGYGKRIQSRQMQFMQIM